jgi:hypothetical protein
MVAFRLCAYSCLEMRLVLVRLATLFLGALCICCCGLETLLYWFAVERYFWDLHCSLTRGACQVAMAWATSLHVVAVPINKLGQ